MSYQSETIGYVLGESDYLSFLCLVNLLSTLILYFFLANVNANLCFFSCCFDFSQSGRNVILLSQASALYFVICIIKCSNGGLAVTTWWLDSPTEGAHNIIINNFIKSNP